MDPVNLSESAFLDKKVVDEEREAGEDNDDDDDDGPASSIVPPSSFEELDNIPSDTNRKRLNVERRSAEETRVDLEPGEIVSEGEKVATVSRPLAKDGGQEDQEMQSGQPLEVFGKGEEEEEEDEEEEEEEEEEEQVRAPSPKRTRSLSTPAGPAKTGRGGRKRGGKRGRFSQRAGKKGKAGRRKFFDDIANLALKEAGVPSKPASQISSLADVADQNGVNLDFEGTQKTSTTVISDSRDFKLLDEDPPVTVGYADTLQAIPFQLLTSARDVDLFNTAKTKPCQGYWWLKMYKRKINQHTGKPYNSPRGICLPLDTGVKFFESAKAEKNTNAMIQDVLDDWEVLSKTPGSTKTLPSREVFIERESQLAFLSILFSLMYNSLFLFFFSPPEVRGGPTNCVFGYLLTVSLWGYANSDPEHRASFPSASDVTCTIKLASNHPAVTEHKKANNSILAPKFGVQVPFVKRLRASTQGFLKKQFMLLFRLKGVSVVSPLTQKPTSNC